MYIQILDFFLEFLDIKQTISFFLLQKPLPLLNAENQYSKINKSFD